MYKTNNDFIGDSSATVMSVVHDNFNDNLSIKFSL